MPLGHKKLLTFLILYLSNLKISRKICEGEMLIRTQKTNSCSLLLKPDTSFLSYFQWLLHTEDTCRGDLQPRMVKVSMEGEGAKVTEKSLPSA